MTWICIRFAWREIGELWQTKNNIRLTIRHTRNPNHLLLNGNDAGSYCILHMLQCFLFWVVRHLQRAITRFPFIIIHVIISGGALHVCFPQVNQQEKKRIELPAHRHLLLSNILPNDAPPRESNTVKPLQIK